MSGYIGISIYMVNTYNNDDNDNGNNTVFTTARGMGRRTRRV